MRFSFLITAINLLPLLTLKDILEENLFTRHGMTHQRHEQETEKSLTRHRQERILLHVHRVKKCLHRY